jgi:hypothetical protein
MKDQRSASERKKAKQKAIARWEGEGGALGPPQPKAGKASGPDGKVTVKASKKGKKGSVKK